MPPALIIVGLGGKPIPVPLLLLWPLLLVALALAVTIVPLMRLEGTTPRERLALPLQAWRVLAATRGLRVNGRTADGERFSVRFC